MQAARKDNASESSDYPDWLVFTGAILPSVLALVLAHRWSRREQSARREQCLREIEAAGGLEAWKRLHFGVPAKR
jgi:hypothetical protein